jgi:hypothetical protein
VQWNPQTVKALQIFLYQQRATPVVVKSSSQPKLRSKLNVGLHSVKLVMNKETESRQLAVAQLIGVGLSVSDERSGVDEVSDEVWDSVVQGGVGQVKILDLHPETLHFRELMSCAPHDVSSRALEFQIRSFQGSKQKAVDSSVHVTMNGPQVVFLNQAWMELIDYVLVGIMEPALLDGEAVMKGLGQKPAGKNELNITVVRPSIRIPRSRSVSECLEVQASLVSIGNSFDSEPYNPEFAPVLVECPPETVVLDHMTIQVEDVMLSGCDAWRYFDSPKTVTVDVVRSIQTNYVRVPAMDISVDIPSVRLGLTRGSYILLRQVADENLAAPSELVESLQSQCAVAVEHMPKLRDSEPEMSQVSCQRCNRLFTSSCMRVRE